MQMMMFSMKKIIIPAILMILVTSCRYFQKEEPDLQVPVQDTTALKIKEPVFIFGIPSDAYNLKTGHIKRNGFLSEILIENGVPMTEIDQVVRNSDSIFDVRKIRSGNHYTLFCDTDSVARARYLIYEHDPTLSYIFSFNDSLNITPYRKEIKKVIRYSSGTIETSLWESMIAKGMHPALAGDLSEIFAWTVDFFGLQKGDSYKVFYEELFIEDKPLGTGKIYGAQFVWAGDTITAIPFIQDGKETYFDVDGNSLRKAFSEGSAQVFKDQLTIFIKPASSDPQDPQASFWCRLCCTDRNSGPGNRRRQGNVCRY